MAKSSIVGVSKVRRLLRRLPDDVTADVKKAVAASAREVLTAMQQASPHGSIAEALTVSLARDGLTARIGLIGKRANRKGFLARIFERGAKAHVIAVGGNGKGARKKNAEDAIRLGRPGQPWRGKTANHPGMRARPFFFQPIINRRVRIIANIKAAIDRAINKASVGS